MLPTLLVLAGLIVLFLIVVAFRPSELEVHRSLTMKTTPERAFEQVNNLSRMNAWNPWVKLDPNLKQTYSGPAEGVGAAYAWDGNANVGAGRQTIVESRPHELVRLKLEFIRPFAGENNVWFTIKPEGDLVTVTWSMTGKLNFISKAMGLFMSMEKMCGRSFDQGLNDMKQIVEN